MYKAKYKSLNILKKSKQRKKSVLFFYRVCSCAHYLIYNIVINSHVKSHSKERFYSKHNFFTDADYYMYKALVDNRRCVNIVLIFFSTKLTVSLSNLKLNTSIYTYRYIVSQYSFYGSTKYTNS